MAINFPDNPSNGQQVTVGGVRYEYNSSKNAWKKRSIQISAASGGGGVTSYDSAGLLPSSSNIAGDLAFVKDNKAMYVWDSSEWDRLYNGPETSLAWTTEASNSYSLEQDGTPITITTAANDPEGFPITYSYDVTPSNQTQATIVDSGNGNFVLTPSTNDSDAGSFTFRSKATDGLYSISKSSTISLSFTTPIVVPNQTGTVMTITNGGDNSWSFQNNTNTGTEGYVYSNTLEQGKKYIEIRIDSTSNHLNFMIGIAPSSSTESLGWSEVGAYGLYGGNGNIYPGPITSGLGSVSINDIIRIAYDTNTGELWFNRNNGSWYPNDPTSSSSLIIAAGAVKIAIGQGSSTVTNTGATALLAADMVYNPPSGFSKH